MCVIGLAGSSEVGSTAPVSVPKMSFGPWPMKCCAIGAPAKATTIEQDDEDPARDRDLVALEADPDELPVASRSNGFELAERATGFACNRGAEAGCAGDDDFFFRRS